MAPPPRRPEEAHEKDPSDVPQRQLVGARIESLHETSSLDFGYYDFSPPGSPPGSPTRERESIVSPLAQSIIGTPEVSRSSTSRWVRPFAAAGASGYQQLGAGAGGASGALGLKASRRVAGGGRYAELGGDATVDSIPEGRTSLDIALLPAAAPVDGVGESDDELSTPLSSGAAVSSPASAVPGQGLREVNDKMRAWQEQEQAGQLSGGLGAGFKGPKIQIRETDLSAPSPPVMQRIPSRAKSFSLRKRLSLSRSATRKALGQSEANRTGQAVQVIIEEPSTTDQHDDCDPLTSHDSKIDLSFVAGDAMPGESEELRVLARRTSTLPTLHRVETFYPNPNWKPFSMRWPYLLMLVLLSFALAGAMEVLYQSSARSKAGGLINFKTAADISPIEYFSIKFLPTLIAVIYGVLWQITDFEVKRLEAYYQLSKEGGATANESLNVDYITSYSFLQPLEALRRRHYAVAISSVASLLAVSAAPTLVSASINLSPDNAARMAHPEAEKHISISAAWSRLNEAVLVIIALLGCVLFHQLQTRRSGLLADVKGIAGLAAMANVSHILMDFKSCDVATHEDIHKKLKKHRYILRNSSLAPTEDRNFDKNSADLKDSLEDVTGQAVEDENKSSAKYHLSLNPHPLMFRWHGCVPYIAAIAIFTVLLPVILFTPLSDWAERAPWVVTALAVGIKLGWGALDVTIRLTEPFYILYGRHAPPKTLTLDYTALPFAWAAARAARNRHWLVFAVGFGTVMTEVLTVLVSSLATVEGRAFEPARMGRYLDMGEETVRSFWVSFLAALFILLYMGVVATLVFVRRRKPFLPRQPNTIASVLAFIHQSKMLYDFVGTEKYSNSAMLQHLEGVNKRYGLGWFEGRDGRTHCGVDEEELSATYRHGVDFSRSNNPWMESFEEWL